MHPLRLHLADHGVLQLCRQPLDVAPQRRLGICLCRGGVLLGHGVSELHLAEQVGDDATVQGDEGACVAVRARLQARGVVAEHRHVHEHPPRGVHVPHHGGAIAREVPRHFHIRPPLAARLQALMLLVVELLVGVLDPCRHVVHHLVRLGLLLQGLDGTDVEVGEEGVPRLAGLHLLGLAEVVARPGRRGGLHSHAPALHLHQVGREGAGGDTSGGEVSQRGVVLKPVREPVHRADADHVDCLGGFVAAHHALGRDGPRGGGRPQVGGGRGPPVEHVMLCVGGRGRADG
mmetsp:Transcript_54116/g.171690  ORF Transcript_54116/g.171690 Transcript_54116/m.171690 type:complete len:289 (-) Transcript_54116:441-1307(-)